MEYGCALYSTAAKTHIDKLTVIQNRCLKIAIGVFKTVKTEILEVESGVYSLSHHFTKVMINIAASIAFNDNHPLRDLMLQYNRYIYMQATILLALEYIYLQESIISLLG